MSCDACKTGFRWNGTPEGTEIDFNGQKTYVTGSSKKAAILLVHDIYGWTFTNARIIADQYAEEVGATVYLPDFFGGEVVDPETLSDPVKRAAFNIPEFIGRHNKTVREPEITAFAQALKKEFPKVGAIGFCYGGWATFRLGANPELIDAVSVAHPSLLENAEIEGLKVPVQILAPETDFAFTPELKEVANRVIPTLGVPYEYVYFPGLVHGFSLKGDLNDKKQKDGLERAKRSVVNFFKEFLL
ncbi:endo-1,3-1,4-beta-D-glucanase [Dendryphion nanum]|uniref:Endo-1,3-1,4-beta-D-glucanase n=1 Tax=Dendryphion nanum TaxID=256645 RepID=A0A9P9IK16_9PLEO|nr:endo-1,3-1,4-beta-D-glucanase [Dendryphion nanum]